MGQINLIAKILEINDKVEELVSCMLNKVNNL